MSQSSQNTPDSKPSNGIAAEIKETQGGQRLFSRWSSGDGFRSTYKRICKRVDISDLRFHDFRHEAASLEKGHSRADDQPLTVNR